MLRVLCVSSHVITCRRFTASIFMSGPFVFHYPHLLRHSSVGKKNTDASFNWNVRVQLLYELLVESHSLQVTLWCLPFFFTEDHEVTWEKENTVKNTPCHNVSQIYGEYIHVRSVCFSLPSFIKTLPPMTRFDCFW
jgi:hypothetical protein